MSKYTGHERELKVKVKAIIVTVSTSRFEAFKSGLKVNDESGDYVEFCLRKINADIVKRIIVPDDISEIRNVINKHMGNANLVVFIGGTGLTKTDITYEAIKPILDKELTTFPSLFTYLSYGDVGTAVLASRVLAGVKDKMLIFCLPGSTGAVKLAMEKIIIPELGHLFNMIHSE